MSRRFVLALGLNVVLLAAAGRGSDWLQFRGGNGGVSDEKQLPDEWGKDKNVAWKAKIPGYAWSSPVVSGDKVFVTTAVSPKQSKPSAGFGMPGGFGKGGFDKGGFGKGGFGKGGFGKGGFG